MPDDAPLPTPTAKRPALLRWKGILVFLGLGAVLALVLPLLANAYVKSRIVAALSRQGWELADETRLSVSVLRTSVEFEALKLRQCGKPADLFTADRVACRLALLDSLASGDLIIDELAAEGCAGSLRRGEDGRVPGLDDDQGGGPGGKPGVRDPDGKPSPGVDWRRYYEWAMEKLKERLQRQAEEAARKPEERREPTREEAEEWPGAVRYQPAPRPGPAGRLPRVLVRKAVFSGRSLALPDRTPFDLTSFKGVGGNLALVLDPGEESRLDLDASTEGAGAATAAWVRRADGSGRLVAGAAAVPIQALTHPALAGSRLAAYGASGTAAAAIDWTWTGWDLQAQVVAQVRGLRLAPRPELGKQVQQTATAVNALKGRPVRWPIRLGGSLLAPTITDTGLDELLKDALSAEAVKDAALGLAKEKADQELQKQLGKNPEAQKAINEAEKNPAAKKGLDALKGLLK